MPPGLHWEDHVVWPPSAPVRSSFIMTTPSWSKRRPRISNVSASSEAFSYLVSSERSPSTSTISSPSGISSARQPCREGRALTLFFPFPHTFRCCETSCRAAYRGATWTSRPQSLVRHLEQEREVRIILEIKKCLLCGRELLHACFMGGSLEAPATQAKHQCSRCVASLPSARGLADHIKWHETQDARARPASRSAPQPAAAQPVTGVDETSGSSPSPKEQMDSPPR